MLILDDISTITRMLFLAVGEQIADAGCSPPPVVDALECPADPLIGSVAE